MNRFDLRQIRNLKSEIQNRMRGKIMRSKFFWQVPQCKKFRIIFEDEDIMVGVSDDNKYQTFRKDTNFIGFTEQEALEQSLTFLVAKESTVSM